MAPHSRALADGTATTQDTADMGEICHPYEPGFAQCVGVPEPTRWNPYGPGLPTPLVPPVRPSPDAGLLVPATEGWGTRIEDELTLAPAPQPVPEPSVVALLLVALVLCAPRAWRLR